MVISCTDADGCCPAGCSALNDNDCLPSCGDGMCGANENKCSCPIDCGECSGDVANKPGEEYACSGGLCVSIYKKNMCGNSMCEQGESDATCREDCASTCGDSICTAEESKCSCPLDCGECTGQCAGACEEMTCSPQGCVCAARKDCCGNFVCDKGETFVSCSSDCLPRRLYITILEPSSTSVYMRGDEMLFRAEVKADSFPGTGLNVSVTGFFGEVQLFDDGEHGDGVKNDAIYANLITLNRSAPTARHTIEFRARKLTLTRDVSHRVTVDAAIPLAANATARVEKGSVITLSGRAQKRGTPFSGQVTWFALFNNTVVFNRTLQCEGDFSDSYRTTTLDPSGNWTIFVQVRDEFGNEGSAETTVEVFAPLSSFLQVSFLSPAPGAYERGQTLSVVVNVSSAGEPAGDASVFLITPNGEQLVLSKVGEGVYSGQYKLRFDDPLGQWEMRANSEKMDNGSLLTGTATRALTIVPAALSLDLAEPSAPVNQGENIQIKISARYPDGSPVSTTNISASVAGQAIQLGQTEAGVYTTDYKVRSLGDIEVKADVGDAYGNSGSGVFFIRSSQVSPLYYIEEYPLVAGAVVFALALALVFGGWKAYLRLSRDALVKRREELLARKKRFEEQYYAEGRVGKEAYEAAAGEYNAELARIEKRLEGMK